MAITKLMHMKESLGCKHDHLRNAIDYILDIKNNQEKTKHGLLVGGNSGTDHKEILENFLETKQRFDKTDGRQGYHFVISFAQGETDEQTAFAVTRDFCERYLGETYDYVFAVHIDKGHLHGHIIFNSVSRVDGYKYHYRKGDWEKIIQPVTDQICVEHDLEPLTFADERVGVSYAEWAAERKGTYNWSHIIRADVDYAIQQASSYEDFKAILKKMNYQLRFGYSKKRKAEYITFAFVAPDGKTHRRRSYNLPPGYSPEEIRQRIQTKLGSKTYEEIMQQLAKKADPQYLKSGMEKSMRTYNRLYQAVSYYKLPNPFAVPAYRVRKDMLRLDKLLDECQYLKRNHISNLDVLENRMEQLNKQKAQLQLTRKTLYGILDQMSEEQLSAADQYSALQKAMMEAERGGSGQFEKFEDEMVQLEKQFPHEMLEVKSRIENAGKELADINRETRMLNRIRNTELETGRPIQEPRIKS